MTRAVQSWTIYILGTRAVPHTQSSFQYAMRSSLCNFRAGGSRTCTIQASRLSVFGSHRSYG